MVIKYDGAKTRNKVVYLLFSNESGAKIEVPVDQTEGNRIISYLSRLSIPKEKPVEHQNDELSD